MKEVDQSLVGLPDQSLDGAVVDRSEMKSCAQGDDGVDVFKNCLKV